MSPAPAGPSHQEAAVTRNFCWQVSPIRPLAFLNHCVRREWVFKYRSSRAARRASCRRHCAACSESTSHHTVPRRSCPTGEPYDATDPELTDDRIRCRKLLRQFNQELEYDDVEGRKAVLRELLGSFDEGGDCSSVLIRQGAFFSHACPGSCRSRARLQRKCAHGPHTRVCTHRSSTAFPRLERLQMSRPLLSHPSGVTLGTTSS